MTLVGIEQGAWPRWSPGTRPVDSRGIGPWSIFAAGSAGDSIAIAGASAGVIAVDLDPATSSLELGRTAWRTA
ncbi:MAG: hypothetical protein U0800_12915 [Isosphaeraceae bacterium]